jgi:hypothetical protein
MADLVDRGVFRLTEAAPVVERLLLEEEPDLVARLQEISVLGVRLLSGRENRRDLVWLERVDQLGQALLQGIAGIVVRETRQHQVAVPLEIGAQIVSHGSSLRDTGTPFRDGPGRPGARLFARRRPDMKH